MPFPIVLIFAGYAVARYWEERHPDAGRAVARLLSGGVEPAPRPKVLVRPLVVTPVAEARNREAYHTHFAQAGFFSAGLFALTRFVPGWSVVALPMYVYATIPYMRGVEESLRATRKVNADVLFFAAHLLILVVGQFFTAAVAVGLVHLGKLSAEKAKGESQRTIAGLFRDLPQSVWLLRDGVEVETPLETVKVGDVVVVSSGGVVPVDGIVREGQASLDQQALTGEAQPAEKDPGDAVFAGTTVSTGRLCIEVEKSGADTTAARIAEILARSANAKSQFQLKGEKWADQATSPMLLASGAVLPIFGPVSTAVFIHSHIGNRIRLFAPLATLRHITLAARHGILVKDGRSLERLHDVDTFLFDKTGTLTTRELQVARVFAFGDRRETAILRLAAAAERKQTHPIANAILKHVSQAGLVVDSIEHAEYRIGYGISLMIDRKQVRVGSARFLASEGIAMPVETREAVNGSESNGNTVVWVSVNDQVAGAIELEARVRPEVRAILDDLRANGIGHIAIVSGDHRPSTEKLAGQLGVDEFFHDVLPEQKAEIVARLQSQGRRVCFIGDGINDALAMRQADVSVSLNGAATIATDVAEIVLMDGSLAHLGTLHEVARSLNATLEKTLKLTVAPGVINLAGAFILKFSILNSLLVSVGFSAIAIRGSLPADRLQHARRARAPKPRRSLEPPVPSTVSD